jgi:rhomboid protease GluP
MMDDLRPEEFHNRAEALVATMTRLQQGLLAQGYRYLDGDPESWPLSAVLMVRDDDCLLISPWPTTGRLRQVWEDIRRQMRKSGLLLVGAAAPDDPTLDELWRQAGGAIAYLDAGTGRMRVRREAETPEVLREDALGALFSGYPDSARQLDPAEELRVDLERRDAVRAPAGDVMGGGSRPLVTLTLIAICALIFFGAALGGGQINFDLTNEIAVRWGALYPPLVYAGEWWRLLTSGFLHANFMHIAFNMFALYSLGTVLEHWQGRWRIAALFLFSVLTSALAALWFTPKGITLGASGGVFGLLGGFTVIALLYWKDYPEQARKQLFGWIPRVLIINAAISLLPGISLAGHAGGLAGGLLIGLIIMRSPVRRNPLPEWALPALALLLAGTAALAHYLITRPEAIKF